MGILGLGLVFWALSAAYHFVQEDATAIAGGAILIGTILLLLTIYSRYLS
jgi:hypothetical protein